MKIVFLARLFYPHIGGVEKHVFEISKLLIKKGHIVTIVTEQHKRSLPKQEQINGITVFRIFVPKNERAKKYAIWKWFFSHQDLIKQADIIHCHDVFFWYLPFRFLFPRKKVFTTFHGYESYPIAKKAIMVRKLSEELSFGNICIGDFINKWYGTKPTFVNYGGVDAKLKVEKEKLKVRNKKALFIGRLDEQTGIKTYVQACEQIKRSIPDFQLSVIGDGKFKLFVKKHAKILGWKKNPESFFQTSQFAFVSRYLSILEAMMAKRLVFAVYDNPLKKDYLSMTPFAKNIVIVSSANELVDKVQFYLKNPLEEKKLVEKSYAWVIKQTWKKVVTVYLKLWNT